MGGGGIYSAIEAQTILSGLCVDSLCQDYNIYNLYMSQNSQSTCICAQIGPICTF